MSSLLLKARFTPVTLVFVFLLLSAGSSLLAQNKSVLEEYFEGKTVELKIDMPASQQGVDVYPRKNKPLDYSKYASRLKKHGTAIYAGDRIIITKLKPKGKHIEFQLGGGGYGTFGDDSDHVSAEYTSKTKREKNLEKAIKRESNSDKKREMKEELDDLRKERERENARLRAQAEETRVHKEEQVRRKALDSGSRFNIRIEKDLRPEDLTPESVMRALAEYVRFPAETFGENVSDSGAREPMVADSPISMKGLKKGMLWRDVAMQYDMPISFKRVEVEGTKVVTAVFPDGENTVTVKFVEGVVASFTFESQ
ncbi:MAG: hypothetical protein ACRBF0_03385 [Calditrichia bacterium]